MKNLERLNKTSYPIYIKGEHIFTGWEGYINDNWRTRYQGFTERPNFYFQLTIKYKSYGRGRSSAVFYFSDEDGYEYLVSMKCMDEFMKLVADNKFTFGNGQYMGIFTIRKFGQSYFLYPIGNQLPSVKK